MADDLQARLTDWADKIEAQDERAFLKGGFCVTLQREETDDLIRLLRDARDALAAYVEA